MKKSDIGLLIKNPIPFEDPPHSKYDKLISFAKQVPPANTVVVHPCDESSLRGACEAAELGIIVPILVGPVAKITAVAKEHGIDISRYQLVDEHGPNRVLTFAFCRNSRTAARRHDDAGIASGGEAITARSARFIVSNA